MEVQVFLLNPMVCAKMLKHSKPGNLRDTYIIVDPALTQNIFLAPIVQWTT